MADQKFKLTLNGNLDPGKSFEEQEIAKYFKIKESYKLSADRSESSRHPLELTDSDIVQIETSSGLEWICLADDIPAIYGEESNKNRADGVETYHMNPEIRSRGGGARSGEDKIKNAILNIIIPEGAKITAQALAKKIDEKKCPNPGLFKLDINGNTIPVVEMPSDRVCLLLIHGTISSYESGFANIDSALWAKMMNLYDGHIYAFNHKTLTKSPIENTLELIQGLPDSIMLDIISHSRGGLVADTLARCDYRNDVIGFSKDDIHLMETEFDDDDQVDYVDRIIQAMKDLNEEANKKRVSINKIVRVACPAAGTILLSKRLDHYLNAILSLLGLAVGSKLNPIYQYVKLFLLKVVEEKSNPESFPGLWSMVPGSTFQVINNRNTKLSSHLVSISGDSKIGGGFLHSLSVILTNLYYWRENDFVVNTNSMTKGLINRRTHVFFKIQNKKIDHFSYFKEETHMKIVLSALNNQSIQNVSWTSIRKSFTKRGIVFKLADMGVLKPKLESGKRPIVILVPGIMGSNIYHKEDRKWLDFEEINKGALGSSLNVSNYKDTSADSIISDFYEDFHDFLTDNHHDVVVHPFDWRQSLSNSVGKLDEVIERVMSHNQPVRIVAHSMGGLLVRQWKIEKDQAWKKFRAKVDSRFIMLGTPWKGSHLLMEVFTGDSNRVKQLHLLDFKHNKRQLLESLFKHQGLFDLLPITDDTLDQQETWDKVYDAAGKRNMAKITDQGHLPYYRKFKSDVSPHLKIDALDSEYIYYVAGKNKKTINNYEIKRSFFRGKYVDYEHTEEGDGSVTWETGIPEGLNPEHLYYVNVEHGNLANDKDIFLGLLEIIEKGKTRQSSFSKSKIKRGSSRGGASQKEFTSINEVPLLDSDPLNNIFGISTYEDEVEEEQTVLEVEVFNGDLKWSKFPVMVGHFKHDGIVSAERALDKYLGNKLSERHLMGFYPGNIGEQDIIFDHEVSPIGAVIIGLGDKDDLTGFNLAKSVEKAMLKYAVFFRDNKMDLDNHEEVSTSISTLLIGSNYGKLPMKESIRSILLGIINANAIIGQFESLKKIKKVEFVDYYEDNAYQCYKILQEIRDEKNTVKIVLEDEICIGYRNKRRLLRDESRSWWQSFSTELKIEDVYDKDCKKREVEYLDFGTYNNQASASQDRLYVNISLARYIAEELSTEERWDPVNSKVIFEMLLPNRYKDFIRNHRNIEWRVNEAAAAFPWEMFHDFAFGDNPTFTESGLIRQLYSDDSNIRPALVRKNNALVIANPLFKKDGLPTLPGARDEGEAVVKILEDHKFAVTDKIEKGPLEIIKSLFSGEFKVLHIASHGLYNFSEGKVGIAIGDGQLLTPGTINQLSAIPEFVFINCCFSGKTVAEDEGYSKSRNMLAANIGTQLIKMGVKAVVVAGWAVNDNAAQVFAKSLYEELLDGAFFGDAVKKARYDCYHAYKDYNTWGAYQCYGDQFYSLTPGGKSYGDKGNLSLENEIIMELDNLLSSAKSLEISIGDRSSIDWIYDKMQTLVKRADTLDKYTSEIIEREAYILTYLGRYAQAVLKYKELFSRDKGMYNVDSLDTYCNIRAKNLLSCTDDHCIITGDNIQSVLSDMKSITLVGKGSRRLSTMGSTYKRAAMLGVDKPEIRKYLEESANLYHSAAIPLGLDKRSSIYQITSFLTISSFCNAGLKNPKIEIENKLEKSVKDYLTKWLEITDKASSDRTNIYDQLAKIQLRMASIIAGEVDKELKIDKKILTDEIIDLYHKQISRCINLKDLIGEVEWIEFHLFMCTEFKKEFKDCIPYFKKMKAFIEPYYKNSEHEDLG